MKEGYKAGQEAAQKSAPTTQSPSTTVAKSSPAAPAAPADPYTFTVTAKDTGKVYKGKAASDVGVAVLDVKTATTLGNQYFSQKPSSGATFVLVRLYVKNGQKDAITLDGSLFKILYNGSEYSYSIQGSTAMEMSGQTDSFFLKQINPGLNAQGVIPFEVPEDINLDTAQVQFRGGMTGKTATVPLKPVIQP